MSISNEDKKEYEDLFKKIDTQFDETKQNINECINKMESSVNKQIDDNRDKLVKRIEKVRVDLNERIDQFHDEAKKSDLKKRIEKVTKNIINKEEICIKRGLF